MEGEMIRNSPVVKLRAASGEAWATKLISRGWSALSTNQKKTARAATGLQKASSVSVPKRPPLRVPVDRKVNRTGGKSMTLTEREFLGNVVSSVGLTPSTKNWVINPRNMSAFPKTSIIALNFNKYKVSNLAVCYSPTCSFETNGRVAIGWNSDASDAVPTNKVQLYGMKVYETTQAQTALRMNIAVDSKVRFMHDSISDDPKLVDLGRLILTTYGFDESSTVVGELFLEYTIVLSDPTYVAQITQRGNAVSSTGPEYASYFQTGGKGILRLHAPGKWVVSLHGSKGAISEPTTTGLGVTFSAFFVVGELGAIANCEVDTQLDETEISTTVVGEGVTQWRVSRA
ncbi:coat protein [Stellaria aquatica mottle virus]|nr:coat protein [Stellaria aquatica mottle virus]